MLPTLSYVGTIADLVLKSALHFCASKGHIDLARILLARKASARVRDKQGQYAIHRAAAIGSTPMVNLLLDHNSPINATDLSGQTALHHAISEGHGETAMTLLRRGAEGDIKDADGNLPIELSPDRKVLQTLEYEINPMLSMTCGRLHCMCCRQRMRKGLMSLNQKDN